MTSEEGDLLLTQSYSPYGGELEEIGGEPATFGYAGQLYDEQTGLLFLRARYYSPSTGRFISHDSWAGDAYMPMSYNKWLYGYGNPMRYTDPSGNYALIDTLFAGLAGGAAGAVAGGIAGACTYDLAVAGQCGCYYKQKAFSMSRLEWSTNFVKAGAIIGSFIGMVVTAPTLSIALGSLAKIGLGIVSVGFGVQTILVSAPMFLESLITLQKDGLNWCNFTGFVFSIGQMIVGVAAIVGGALSIAEGAVEAIGSTSTSSIAGSANGGNVPTNNQKVYRAINQKDLNRINQGLGIEAKNPSGRWTLKEHLVRGSNKAAWANDPYVSTTTDIAVAEEFNNLYGKLGIVEIDLSKVNSPYFKGYEIFPRLNGAEGLPYHYSVWQQEISIFREIPFEAIIRLIL